jgi:hypothetical protein
MSASSFSSRIGGIGFGPPAVAPIGGASLRVEVDDRGLDPGKPGRYGQMDGEGGFARAPLLAQDRYNFHCLVLMLSTTQRITLSH